MDIMKTDFILVREHNFTFGDLNEMQPYERQVNIVLVLDFLDKRNKALNTPVAPPQ